ncbi:tyrosine-type recombinase/integrase [Paraburkholderia caffeinilytica]|uniref:tyrosine-type recombinase/integrase n=1 Tax=Paraburkholderia caffeinilytica TaxID=1761016 RepID=UPI003DA197EE
MKTAVELSDTDVDKAKPKAKPYRLRGGHRLYVLVSVAGTKTWLWAYRAPDGKDRVYKIGKFPDVSAAAAREARSKLEKILKSGKDPKDEAEAEDKKHDPAKGMLWSIVEKWLKKKKPVWSAYYYSQAVRFLERYVKDGIGQMQARDIAPKHIYELLSGIAEREKIDKASGEVKSNAPHVAIRIRHHLQGIFSLALVMDEADRNPVKDVGLTEVLGNKKLKTRNNAKLKPDQLGGLLAKLEQHGGTEKTRIGLKLLLLTLARTGELRGASWSEFDLDSAVWVVPASRMKMRVEHTVPLSKQAVALLRELQKYGNKGLLFPNAKHPTKPMDANTFNHALARLGHGESLPWFRAHGSRGTGSTLINGMLANGARKYPRDVIEAQLAHKVRGVEGAYNDADYLDQRIPMMQDWADYLDQLRAAAMPENIPASTLEYD